MDERERAAEATERWEDEGGPAARQRGEGPASSARREERGEPELPGARRSRAAAHAQARDRGAPGRASPPRAVGRAGAAAGDLPSEAADWFTKPLARFFKVEAAAAVMLLFATLAALVVANSGGGEGGWAAGYAAFWETRVGVSFGEFGFSRSLRHWVNDGLMTLFFFVVALELKRELVLGELRQVRRAALSLAGAVGGMLVPAGLFLALMRGREGVGGWGTVTATDTAFALGCLAVLGPRVPPGLRLFILSLAIFDDVGAVLVVAFGYGQALNWAALAAAIAGVVALAGVGRLGIRSIPAYFMLGAGIWLCFDASGVHPTVAGVALGLLAPTGRWVANDRMRAIFGLVLAHPPGEHAGGDSAERRELQRAGRAARESISPVERLEMVLHPWVGFAILPVFALANAGVAFSSAALGEPLFGAVVASFVLGKPLGVLGVSWIAVRLGVATRPPGLTWPLIAGGAFLTGIGFTMALFIAGLALGPAPFDVARMGILLASVVSALAGIATLFWLTSGARGDRSDGPATTRAAPPSHGRGGRAARPARPSGP